MVEESTRRAKPYLQQAVLQNDMPVISEILNNGFPVNEPINGCQQTLLHQAVIQNRSDLLKMLKQFNPNVNAQDSAGRTAIHFACRAGNLKMV